MRANSSPTQKRSHLLYALGVFLAVMLSLPTVAWATPDVTSYDAELSFNESGIEEKTAGTGYTIDGANLEITSAGTYVVSGSCSEGGIVVAKSLSDVVLVLDDLSLASSSTAPLVVKKGSDATLHLCGNSTLTNSENPANESSSDTTVADAFEGACIKAKSESTVTFCGEGNLNVVANTKNGIKGGSKSTLIFNQEGAIDVTGSGSYYGGSKSGAAINNGIACDGELIFNQGTYNIYAAGDGIKSAPDATDESAGTTVDSDSAGTITVNGGTFNINVDGDGFQADTALTITNGTFSISTWQGHSVWNDTLANLYSCKGLKAAGDRAEELGLEPTITICGGTFTLNCGDDAIHSDAYATVTGGTFTIQTGDDGMHADTSLILGTEGGVIVRNPDVTILSSYEGLEAGTVYLYSGRYQVVASDDGVNAAGGSSSGTEGSGGGNDPFKPGGGGPGGNTPGKGNTMGVQSTAASDYNIYIYGGDLYVNCDGDGLDSNGGLYLYGGQQAVFSQTRGGDNSAIDADGTIVVDGATVFTAGTTGADGSARSGWFGSNQKYKTSTSTYSSGAVVNASAGSSVVLSYKLPKAVDYLMASWPSSVSSTAPSLSTASSVSTCKGGSWSHAWDTGVEGDGVVTYTCTSCGTTETQSVASTTTVEACSHVAQHEDEQTDEGYAITFAGDAGVKEINVYYTQDYTTASETVAANGSAVSRNGDTGEPDSTGSGQLNFQVVLNEGYTLNGDSSVSATEGAYKNKKIVEASDQVTIYRFTKITGAMTVTITTTACTHANVSNPSWVWADDCSSATLYLDCADCEQQVSFAGEITSELKDASTITFTASRIHNEVEYTDTRDAAPFTAAFEKDQGVESVNVYYTQDYESPSEEDATSAVARDGDTGDPVIDGTGQVNFQVVLADGYKLQGITVTAGTSKNIKGPSDTGQELTYRITKISASTTITISTAESGEHQHVLTSVDAAQPSCTEEGHEAYWYCAGCEKYFVDADGTEETTWEDLVIPSSGHSEAEAVQENYVAPTATSPGSYDLVVYCGTCQTELSRETVIVPATGTSDETGVDSTEDDATTTAPTQTTDTTTSTSTTTTTTTTPATSVAAGASAASVDALLTSRASDADPTGSVFNKLRLRVTKVTKKTQRLTWNKVSGATKYVVYGNRCGKNNKLVKLATVSGKTWTNKKLASGKHYKYLVVAVSSSNKVISASKVVHVATTGGKVTNIKRVTITKKSTGKKATRLTLKKGKSVKLKATVTKVSSKLTLKTHRKVTWESSNTSVATVTSSGKVKAVGKGTCYVYAYAQNGVFARCKVTVS